jgi:hypothetical protein
MRLARIIRIYDLGFWEEALLDTDRLFSAIIQGKEFQRRMTTPEFHFLLGKAVASIERKLGVTQPSLLATAWRYAVPIWVGAVQDGSIFLNVVKLKRLLGAAFRFELDINDDVYSMAAMQHFCRHRGSKKLAVWMLGGGVPKNSTLQGEPLLDQILSVPTTGFDIDVQFCVDPVDNGALSSAPAGEVHTWGKVSVEAVESGSVCVPPTSPRSSRLTHACFHREGQACADAPDGPDGGGHRLPRPRRATPAHLAPPHAPLGGVCRAAAGETPDLRPLRRAPRRDPGYASGARQQFLRRQRRWVSNPTSWRSPPRRWTG